MQSAVTKNMIESLFVPTFRVGYTIERDALGCSVQEDQVEGSELALVKHPVMNSSCRDGNSSINIAVAVAIDGGLVAPVLQGADKVDIYSLSRKWTELVDKVRARQLQTHGYNTGTFTLSNLGMFSVDHFDAILPPGTGAIMAVGASPFVVVTKGWPDWNEKPDASTGVCGHIHWFHYFSSRRYVLFHFILYLKIKLWEKFIQFLDYENMSDTMQLLQVNVTVEHRVIYDADLASFLRREPEAKIIEDPKDLTL